MEEWRTKLIESLPDHRSDWEDPENSIYLAFTDLNAMCQEAHERGDDATLRAIYDFAAWCARQEEEDLWNAAGVSFYEHVVDHPIAVRDFPRWVPPDVFRNVAPLLEERMDEQEFAQLKLRYERH